MTNTYRGSDPIDVPRFLYGTAWKEERTQKAVEMALAAGFRGIDTANQRKHYNEAAVGAAIRNSHQPVFLQTKFTYAESQDHRLPFDPKADYPTQVRQSFARSLEHLGVPAIDSFVLHGPRTRSGLSRIDRDVWRTMEDIQREGGTRLIGISNATAEQLSILCEIAEVKPAFIQNRCYAQLGWDYDVREACRRQGVIYQGFSLLTANVRELKGTMIGRIAEKYGVPRTRVIFAFALQLGMICLTGTTDPDHMKDDLAAIELQLTPEEMEMIENVSA